MKKGSLITICPQCRRVLNFNRVGFKSHDLGDDVEEVGIECPGCGYWQPVYWLNAELKRLQQNKAPTRKDKREYVHKFQKWQRVARKRYQHPGQIIAGPAAP